MEPEAIISQISLEDDDLVMHNFDNSLYACVNLSLVFSGNMSKYVSKKKKLKKKKFLIDLINGELPINGMKNINRQNLDNKSLDFKLVENILSKYGTVSTEVDRDYEIGSFGEVIPNDEFSISFKLETN